MTLRIKNVKNIANEPTELKLDNDEDHLLDGENKLTILPALIDPHVHFRTPGHPNKEDWTSGAQAAIAGGVTTVFDMPNTSPACTSKEQLHEKKKIIDAQLAKINIPLHYQLYFGVTNESVERINEVQKEIVGVKIYMGSSTGDLLLNNPKALERVFQICGQKNLIVSIHAEDEATITQQKNLIGKTSNPADHSKIRCREAAITATKQALDLSQKYNTELCILHTSTKEEIALIREAKKHAMLVFCEVSPHHLFLSENDYAQWGTRVQVNPPLRTLEDQEALWEAIEDGTVDMIGSDHAPHTLEEKKQPYGKSPSGIAGIELTLPLLLNAYNEGKIGLKKIIDLTRKNCETIFNLPHNNDIVLVDLNRRETVQDNQLKTKCRHSPYAGRTLKGWPVYTILEGNVYHVAHNQTKASL